MKTKKEKLLSKKQKQSEVREVVRLMGVGVYGGKDFLKRIIQQDCLRRSVVLQ